MYTYIALMHTYEQVKQQHQLEVVNCTGVAVALTRCAMAPRLVGRLSVSDFALLLSAVRFIMRCFRNGNITQEARRLRGTRFALSTEYLMYRFRSEL